MQQEQHLGKPVLLVMSEFILLQISTHHESMQMDSLVPGPLLGKVRVLTASLTTVEPNYLSMTVFQHNLSLKTGMLL